ncbi:MAG TPA: ATP-binding protein, partial [Rariglobus sp.]
RLALAADLPRIEADTGMIEQVLMNLVVNARDAMPSGGRVVIGTCVREIGAAEVKTSPGKRAGTFVCLSVEDTGSGIAPEIIPRIFEPFFTTKGLGQGTGLGLAMVFGIVENHQGWLQIESRVGEGSRFHVFFPATAALPPVLDPVSPDVSAGRGSETILLVEDDAQVRELTLTVLRSYGYEVLTASTGVEAIELWRANEERIRLLLTDVVMPDTMTGLELAQVLRAAKTSLKVICMSGYHQTALGQKMSVDSSMVFVQKPCLPQTLARVVRETLDRV